MSVTVEARADGDFVIDDGYETVAIHAGEVAAVLKVLSPGHKMLEEAARRLLELKGEELGAWGQPTSDTEEQYVLNDMAVALGVEPLYEEENVDD